MAATLPVQKRLDMTLKDRLQLEEGWARQIFEPEVCGWYLRPTNQRRAATGNIGNVRTTMEFTETKLESCLNKIGLCTHTNACIVDHLRWLHC